MKLFERLERLPRAASIAVAAMMILLVASFDYVTTTDVSLAAFYLIPISLVAVTLGGRQALAIAALSILAWWASGKLADQDDFRLGNFILWWNAFVQFAVDLLVIWALTSLRSLQQNLETRAHERAAVLVEEIARRERLQRELLEVSEREHRRIGQDLHDGLCQHLAGTALAAEVLREKLASKRIHEADDAEAVGELVVESIAISHRIASGLHPVELDSEGLMHALAQFAETASDLYKVDCRFSTSGVVLVNDNKVAENLYRIAQEAVRNAVKHGAATSIIIRLFSMRGRPALTVIDNGTGFEPERASSAGMGLRIMRHRAQAIGARFAVDRGESGGMVVSILPESVVGDPVREHAGA